MTSFGGRQIPLIPAPAAVPDFSRAVSFEESQKALAGVLGLGTTVAQTQAQKIRRDSENRQLAQKLKLGEVEIEQARLRIDAEEKRRQEHQLRFDTEQQKRQYEDLADLEALNVAKVLSDMEPAEKLRYLAANPIADPKNHATQAALIGRELAQSATTRMFQRIVEGVRNGEQISVADLIVNEVDQLPFDQVHPEAVSSFKETLLQQGEGFLRGQINAAISAQQAEAERLAEWSVRQQIAQALDGERDHDSLRKLAEDTYAVVPYVGNDPKAAARRLAEDIDAVVRRRLIDGQNPDQLSSFINSMDAPIRRSLDSLGTKQAIATQVESNERARVASIASSIAARAADFDKNDDLGALRALLQDADQLPAGTVRDNAKVDLEQRIKAIEARTANIGEIQRRLADPSRRGDPFNPSTQELNKAWDQQVKFADSGTVLGQFVRAGLGVPNKAVEDLKNDWLSEPVAALQALERVDQVDKTVAARLAQRIDSDGALGAAIELLRGLPEDAPERTGIVTVLSSPAALAQMTNLDALKAAAKPEETLPKRLRSGPSGSIGAEAVRLFDAAITYRFLESFTPRIGIADPKAALERAKKLAANDVAERMSSVSLNLPAVTGLFRDVPFSSDLYGIGSIATPDKDAREAFTDALHRTGVEFVEEQGRSVAMRPDLGFKMADAAFVPVLENGRAVAFMEWKGGKGTVIRGADDRFAGLNDRLLKGSSAEDREDFAFLRNRFEYRVNTVEEYDRKFHETDRGGGLGRKIMAEYQRRWIERGLAMPQTDGEVSLFMLGLDQFARELGFTSFNMPAAGSKAE